MATLAAAFAAGAAAGALYFAGLWATVRALPSSHHPGLVTAASFIVRFGLAALLFTALVRVGGWSASVAALLGFTAARALSVRRLLPSRHKSEQHPA
jgi:F1F0 ATPase subunit 2